MNRILKLFGFRQKHPEDVDVQEEPFENRFKPGRMSVEGFMGEDESLDEIIADDSATLERLGITYDQIADRIEYFIKNEWRYAFGEATRGMELKEKNKLILARKMRFNDEESYMETMLDDHYIINRWQYKGFQGCPWCDYVNLVCGSDYAVENTDLKERITFPGLIVHLIREHHFFEGKGTSHRVDPEDAVRVLEIDIG
jgi:hypothetical protein